MKCSAPGEPEGPCLEASIAGLRCVKEKQCRAGVQSTVMDLKRAWLFALGNVYLGCQGHDWVAIHYLHCVPTASLPVLGLA